MRPERVRGEAGFEIPSPLTRIARVTRIIAYAALFALILLVFVVAFLRAGAELWAIVGFIVAGLAMVAGIVFNFEAVADAVISRKTAIGANSVLMVALALALLAMVNYLSARHHIRADLTSAQRFTLDGRTKQLLARLDSDLEVATFLILPQYQGQADLTVPVRDLLEQCEVESDLVNVTHTSPLAQPPHELVRAAEKLGFSEDAFDRNYNFILLAYKGKTKKLSRSDLVEEVPPNPYMRRPPPEGKLKIEDAITSAIRDLLEEEEVVIYAVSGHGERPLTHQQRGVGLSLAKAELKGQNYDVRDLKLAEKNEVPEDASLVFIVSPRKSFTPAEVEVLGKYLDGGGGLVVLVDSILGAKGARTSGLEDLLEKRGIKVRQDVEVKQGMMVLGYMAFMETIPAAWYSPSHPVTQPLYDARIATQFYRPCALERVAPEDPSLEVEELVKTSERAWGETSAGGAEAQRPDVDGGGDVKGPVLLAAASGPKGGDAGGRLVVFANAYFACDAMYRELANGDLFINAVSWVVGVQESIGIVSRDPDIRSARMTDSNKNKVLWVDVVLVPVLVLACGAVVLWLRRR